MSVPALVSESLARKYTLISRAECGCAEAILHNAQEAPQDAARMLIEGMQQGRRVECLPAQLTGEIPWTCPAHQVKGAGGTTA